MAVRTRPPSAALISSEDGSCAATDAQPSALVATSFAALRPGVRNPSMVAKTRPSSAALTLLCVCCMTRAAQFLWKANLG